MLINNDIVHVEYQYVLSICYTWFCIIIIIMWLSIFFGLVSVGTVKVWDPRQKDTPVANMEPTEGEAKRDCWTVAFGVYV